MTQPHVKARPPLLANVNLCFSGADEPVLTRRESPARLSLQISSPPPHPIKRASAAQSTPPPLSLSSLSHTHAQRELTMRKSSCGHVIGVPVTSKAYALEEATTRGAGAAKKEGDRLAVSLTHPSPYASFGYKHSSKGQVIHWVNKLGRRAQGFRDHVTLGPKLSETVKGKLSLGARILQAGGVERVFRQAFSAEKGERLVKALQCYLYTTSGPIAGMLFVSTRKIAFRSDRSLTVTSLAGDVARVPYKVVVPLGRIKRVQPSENADNPEQKYIHMATVDGFEFWFMGFVSYQRCCKYMQQVISSQL
ncbi:hypothetical protein CFC21_092952 [Triticum aestivum]|uniref:GRAM domain-containing protein n=3 Tax=Triticinae TaxID=1648030 RepID=A0A3B6QIF2_WHEAT|nr:GEM-like protein 4 [Triticum aestivum]KAF7090145.1 hypothetical protein CFC21_092952 [Triticum aestivum]